MLKDLMKSIFNEDIDLDEELEEDEYEMEEQEAKTEDVALEDVVTPEEDYEDITEAIPVMDVQQPSQPEPVQAAPRQPKVTAVQAPVQPRVHSESFSDMSIDDISQPESDVMRPRPYKYDRRKLKKVGVRTQPEEEYQAVISPIFGNTKDEEKDYHKVHNAIALEKPMDDPDFVQVISPMFGTNVAGNIPIQTIPTKDPERTITLETEDVSVSSVVEATKPEVVQEKLFQPEDEE